MLEALIGRDLVVLVFVVLLVAFLLLPVWAVIDAAQLPEWAFQRAGTSKTLWIVLPIVGIFLCGLVGFVAGVMWFANYRGQVRAAASGGGFA